MMLVPVFVPVLVPVVDGVGRPQAQNADARPAALVRDRLGHDRADGRQDITSIRSLLTIRFTILCRMRGQDNRPIWRRLSPWQLSPGQFSPGQFSPGSWDVPPAVSWLPPAFPGLRDTGSQNPGCGMPAKHPPCREGRDKRVVLKIVPRSKFYLKYQNAARINLGIGPVRRYGSPEFYRSQRNRPSTEAIHHGGPRHSPLP
jgi:hypothetical protein